MKYIYTGVNTVECYINNESRKKDVMLFEEEDWNGHHIIKRYAVFVLKHVIRGVYVNDVDYDLYFYKYDGTNYQQSNNVPFELIKTISLVYEVQGKFDLGKIYI